MRNTLVVITIAALIAGFYVSAPKPQKETSGSVPVKKTGHITGYTEVRGKIPVIIDPGTDSAEKQPSQTGPEDKQKQKK